MKKRMLVLMVCGVSFVPAVFAAGPSESRLGQVVKKSEMADGACGCDLPIDKKLSVVKQTSGTVSGSPVSTSAKGN